MARGGISKGAVAKARESLVAKGVRPSIDAVRIELGNTGSKTTISRYLKEISEEEGSRLDDEELLSENLKEIIGRLSQALRNEAKEIVESAESRHKAEIESVEEKLADAERSLETTQASLAQREGELAEEQQAHKATSEKLIELKSQVRENTRVIQDLEVRIHEKDQYIESLENKHQHARESLEHFRESVKEQRDQELRRHEQQIQQLQADARQQAQSLVVKQNELTQLNKDNSRLSTELKESQRRARDLQGELRTTTARVNDLVTKQTKTESDLALAQENYRSLEIKHTELIKEYELNEERLADKESAMIQLKARLETQAALFKDLKGHLAYVEEQATITKTKRPV
jgi:chromosome segregation ATPase